MPDRPKVKMDQIAGKTAFITGAQGIGLGIARAFARRGVKVALADVDPVALSRAKAALSDFTQVETFPLDVRNREAYAVVANETEARMGPVELLFNNAGVAGAVSVTQMTYELWDWMLGVNLNGVFNGIQTFVPRMLGRGGGHIINTSSGAGLVGSGSGFMYQTSKHAVVGLSESLRVELEPYGIGVSVLCPGPVATDIIDNSGKLRPAKSPAPPTLATEAGYQKAKAMLALGTGPDAVGEMVLEAVIANRLYIYTDTIMAEPIKARMRALLDAIPRETGLADHSRRP